MIRAVGFRALCFALALAALFLMHSGQIDSADGRSAFAVYALPYRLPSAQARADLELTVLNLMNQARVAAGLAPLMPHAGLRSAARAHGLEMFVYGYLSHQSRDGRTPAQRVVERHVRVRLVGENLAYAPDVVTAHTALMASGDHRQNILSPQFGLVGIGVIDGGPYGVIIVQDLSDAPAASFIARPTPPLGRPIAKNTPQEAPTPPTE